MILTNFQKVCIVGYFLLWLMYPEVLFGILVVAVVIKFLVG